MIKLFKYLKSSIISIFVIILLLIAQAALDLKLPDYTSKIIIFQMFIVKINNY